jgi:ankyrin repeat protein
MKILALIILVFVSSNCFASESCESLFERTAPSPQELESVINQLHSLRRQALTSDHRKAQVANMLYKQKFKELSQILSESEIQSKLKEVELDTHVLEDSKNVETIEKEKIKKSLIKVQEFLEEIGIPIDGKDNVGRTPLHMATIKNRTDLIVPLIFLGVDVNGRTNSDSTPLYLAAANGRTEVVEILIRSGADITFDKKYGAPLSAAALNGHLEIVEMLCNAGACADKSELNAALYSAATSNHKGVVEVLIKLGADVNHQPVVGRRLLSLANVQAHKDIVEILKKAGAER